MAKAKKRLADSAAYLAIMSETLNRLESCACRQAAENSDSLPGGLVDQGEWSLGEILAHLRACAEIWTYSIYAMLSVDDPELAQLDPRRWVKVTGYAAQEFKRSPAGFIPLRRDLMDVLRELDADQWNRGALIGGRRQTVFSQVRRMALHEQGHWAQLEQAWSTFFDQSGV